MRARGHAVRFLLRDARAAADLEDMRGMACEPAPVWVGPPRFENPLNFGQILWNFGYADPGALRQLIDAWRERIADAAAIVANVAPAAHIAARTLGVPSFEVSQGFHVPPPVFPAPPLRDWEPAPRAALEAADRAVLGAINSVLSSYQKPPIPSIGELFRGRSALLTYPELDVYSERGPADYFGVPRGGEGSTVPAWPGGRGPRVFAYVYSYARHLERLLEALVALDCPTLMLCRDIDPGLRAKHDGGPLHLAAQPMAVSRLLPGADLVVCHGSHQMTAQALLAGKPVLALPTQLEQFLTTRRVVRFGAGLGIALEVPEPDFKAALTELGNSKYRQKAAEFAQRYAHHDPDAALATLVARCQPRDE
jgi:UDP:flavonoid glycosyltransferase YjiC (YdhE family)